MRSYLAFALALASALILTSCGGGGGGGGATTGRLSVIADFQDPTRTVPGYADTLRVTVTPPAGVTLPGGFPNPFVLTRTSSSRVLDDLTPNAIPYVLDMEALTDGTVVGTAQRSIVITAGEFREVDVSANLESEIASVAVEGISQLTVGVDEQFTAYARDASNATLFSGEGFHFTSSNPSVVSIDPDTGLASPHTDGVVTIVATLRGTALSGSISVSSGTGSNSSITVISEWEDPTRSVPGYADELRVTVTPPPGIELPAGLSNPFLLTRANSSKQLSKLEPSGDPYMFDMEALTDGTVVGIAQRSVTLSSNEQREIDVSANLDSLVDHIEVEGVATMEGGESHQFVAHAKDASNNTLFSSPGFSWQTGDPSTATVNASGLVLAVGDGVTTVNATLIGTAHSSTASLTVTPKIRLIVYARGSRIETLNSDGTGRTLLFMVSGELRDPELTDDGLRVVYASINNGSSSNDGIYIANIDGSNAQQLTTGSHFAPTISPDGSYIVYTDSSGNKLGRVGIDGTPMSQLTGSWDIGPSFNGDGSRIAFTRFIGGGWQVCDIKADGTGFRQLTSGGSWDRFRAAYSPNGNYIVFSQRISGGGEPSDIYRMDSDGTNVIQLTNHPADEIEPEVSPDGRWIVFASSRDTGNPLNFNVHKMDINGGQQVNLQGDSGSDHAPSWGH